MSMRWWVMVGLMGCAGRASTGLPPAAAASAKAVEPAPLGVVGGPVELIAPNAPVGLGETVVLELRNVGEQPWVYTRMSRPCVEGHWTHPSVTLPSGERASENYSGPGRLCPTVEPTPRTFSLEAGTSLDIPLSTLQPLYAHAMMQRPSTPAEAERSWTAGTYDVQIRLPDQVLTASFVIDAAPLDDD